MILFKDIVTGAELFTDSNKIEMPEEFGGQIMKVTCREKTEEIGNDFDIGANASQEEQGEALEACVKKGLDLVLDFSMEEVTHLYEKPKHFNAGMKCYMKCAGKCLKKADKQVDQKKFAEGFKNFTEFVKANFDDIQFFSPPQNYEGQQQSADDDEEEKEPEPMLIPCYRDPATGVCSMYFPCCTLIEEKC